MTNVVPIRRFEKRITFFSEPATVACDGNCEKAFGISQRPRIMLGPEPDIAECDNYAWLADCDVGIAPIDPGTYEGGYGKPLDASGPADMNKWCVRECERCVMSERGQPDAELPLPDLSQRYYNRSPHTRG